MTYWQVSDATPQQWPMQRCLSEPSSLALAELIQQICSISQTKAVRVVKTVCNSANLAQLRDVSAVELQNAGLTQQQTVKLLAALEVGKRAYATRTRRDKINDAETAAIALFYELGFSTVEKVAVLIMDKKNNLIAKEIVGVGSIDECIADPRVIFERILRNRGTRFVLAHCHPSGDPQPSPSDIRLTRGFLKASRLMNFEMVDHVVIAQDDYASIRKLKPQLWREQD